MFDLAVSSAPAENELSLADRYAELASLAGGLAHEIRNPLGTLSLNLQLLAEDLADPRDQRERRALQRVESLRRETDRLEEILNDFLRFAGVTELERRPVDINDPVQEMIDFIAPQASARKIVTRGDLRAELPLVSLDIDLFKQALLNLLLNGQNAMPDGGELILRTRANGDGVHVEVIDTGAGIAPEHMSKIFRPFFSTREQGSGLGLPTARKIIEAHGGRIAVESEMGKGTAFRLTLPTADASLSSQCHSSSSTPRAH